MDFTIVPVPSSSEADEKRGFNHVFEIAKLFSLPIENCLFKTENVKQSDRNSLERTKISNSISIKETSSLKGKKVLILDDIYTTGSTIKACINLVKTKSPKKIKVLVVCKTRDLDNITKTNTK